MPSKQAKKKVVSSKSDPKELCKILKKTYPDATCELDYKNPLQLLIATILAAQCTDARVNIVTKDLFKKYKSAKAFADADPLELEEDIRSTGFFRQKTKSIIQCCQGLVERRRQSSRASL